MSPPSRGGFYYVQSKVLVSSLVSRKICPDWKNEIGDLLGYPYAYCIHDKDKTKDGEARKTHVHMILALSIQLLKIMR